MWDFRMTGTQARPGDIMTAPRTHLSPTSPEGRNQLALAFAQIASDAGVAVMEVFNSDFETRTKADASPVSDADERAEEIILARLADILPGVPVLAEEEAAREGVEHRDLGDLFLLVDPVDGTKEFINKRKDFTVNIALISKGDAICGAVYAPARKEMYAGGATALYWENFAPGDIVEAETATSLQTRTREPGTLTAVASSSHLDDKTKAFLDSLKITDIKSIGSSLKFCLVALGKADVYPRWGPTMEWDTAAGHAVLNAAGGVVLTPEGAPFTYGLRDEGYLNGPFIAWGNAPD